MNAALIPLASSALHLKDIFLLTHRPFGPRSAFVKGLSVLLIVISFIQIRPARGAPGDIFTIPAPVIGAEPPKATDIKGGDASVSTQTGALQYSYPIHVPPGRHGMAPSLALAYSSQSSIYGTLAAGWSLSIPMISEDTSQGRLRTHPPLLQPPPADPAADDRFVSSMAGGRTLVKTIEPAASGVIATYRAQNDSSFARYQRMSSSSPFRWQVLTSDGKRYEFGASSQTSGCVISDGYAPLTREIDEFGNQVLYTYQSLISHECRLSRIDYGANTPAGLGDFARVELGWRAADQCSNIPIGSQTDFRTGSEILTGASELVSVTATAFDPSTQATAHTRVITISYSYPAEEGGSAADPCAQRHSAFRVLSSIQESAWGTDSPRVDLPPVTFTYGAAKIDLSQDVSRTSPFTFDDVPTRNNLGWGLRGLQGNSWPTVESMMLDIDGDGVLDRLINKPSRDSGTSTCEVRWQRGIPTATDVTYTDSGSLVFGSAVPSKHALPALRWQGGAFANPNYPANEWCALNGQVTAYQNSHANPGFCHDGTQCDPLNENAHCPDGSACPVGGGDPRTYLAYRWLDMDGRADRPRGRHPWLH